MASSPYTSGAPLRLRGNSPYKTPEPFNAVDYSSPVRNPYKAIDSAEFADSPVKKKRGRGTYYDESPQKYER